MEVKGMTPGQLQMVVAEISNSLYAGNIVVDWENGSPRLLNQAGTRFRGRILARSSRGPGARRSWSGRRLTSACWHVFRDVFREALRRYPGAVFTTSMARYTAANFEDTYPATGSRNIGSAMEPVTMPQLCDHSDDAVWTGEAFAPVQSRRLHVYVTRTVVTPVPPVLSDEQRWVRRLDAVERMEPGICGWCKGDTGAASMMWCCEVCHDAWQHEYEVS